MYVVLCYSQEFGYDGFNSIIGVFSTIELANNAIKRCRQSDVGMPFRYNYYIDKFEVDSLENCD